MKILGDLGEVAAAVEPDVQPQPVGVGELPLVARPKQRAPQRGRNHQPRLRPPVVGQVDPVKAPPGDHRHQLALEVEDQPHQPRKPLRLGQEIDHAVLEAAQQRVRGEARQVQAGQPVAVAALLEERRRGGHALPFAQRRRLVSLGRVPVGQVRRGRVAHRPVVHRLQLVAPLLELRIVHPLLAQHQVVNHHVPLGLVGVDEPDRDALGRLKPDGLTDEVRS